MSDLNSLSKQMETDPNGAVEGATGGKYKDAVTDDTNTDGKLPTTNMPKAADPSPFTLGPTSSGQR